MLDYLIWSYREDNNCWDYVRHWLINRYNVDPAEIPKYGIHPNNKGAMTNEYSKVKIFFVESDPVEGSVACHFMGRVLHHVGIVIDGQVREVGEKWKTVRSTPVDKWKKGKKCKFYAHYSL
jgi:hypothetical protein